MKMWGYAEALKPLNRLYNDINSKFFNGQLIKPVLRTIKILNLLLILCVIHISTNQSKQVTQSNATPTKFIYLNAVNNKCKDALWCLSLDKISQSFENYHLQLCNFNIFNLVKKNRPADGRKP